MKNQLALLKQNVAVLEKFVNFVQARDPELHLNIDPCECRVTNFLTDADRDTILAQCAEVFGTENWTCEPDGNKYNWTKEFLGVRILLWNAAKKPSELPRPVNPQEFPLLLKTTEAAE